MRDCWLFKFIILTSFLSSKTLQCRSETVLQHVIYTRVAILGGGLTGIIAARTLDEKDVGFVIVEARDELGKLEISCGRMQNIALNNGVQVELGPNWIYGLGEGASQNRIYTLALENNLQTVTTKGYGDIPTFDNDGPVDMKKELNTFRNAFSAFLAGAGHRILNKQGDLTARAGLGLSGYHPRTYLDDAAEYCLFDVAFGQSPEQVSFLAAAENHNFTYNGFSPENEFVMDQRGFKVIAQATAAKFLKHPDPRLLLNHTATQIDYSSDGDTIYTQHGIVIKADYAIYDDVSFQPPLPDWKREAIEGMSMVVFTKIFLIFNSTFWSSSRNQIYADPSRRGFHACWVSLDHPDVLPGSHVLFAIAVGRESIRIERQSDAVTQAEIMDTLCSMYGPEIPEPTQIFIKKWRADPLFRDSYSSWGPSYSPDVFDALRAPVDTRLWFTGEATSFRYYGYLQGAYTEGQSVAISVAQCIFGDCSAIPNNRHSVVSACGKTFLDEDVDLEF